MQAADNLVLIVDDDTKIRKVLSDLLLDRNFNSIEAENGYEGISKLEQFENVKVVLLDIWMPKLDGLETLKIINKKWPGLPVIVISGHANIDIAVQAIKIGAYDFIEKPFSAERFYLLVDHAMQSANLYQENLNLKKKIISQESTIIGQSASITNLLKTISKVAATDSRVLISGENGSGKELVAKQLHLLSNRSANSLVEVNCAAIPNDLIESELFGHEKGSFTGALKKTIGKFEQADRGTIFLDEIGDMSLNAQAKVLRAIEQQQITRVGGNTVINIDTRIIAATNKNLQDLIAKGLFREDLYYRLSIIPIYVPPLRQRTEDIPLLVEYFTSKLSYKNNDQKLPKTFSHGFINALKNYLWPGNVRELRNLIERLLILTSHDHLTEDDLPSHIFDKNEQTANNQNNSIDYKQAKDNFEKEYLINCLQKFNWNVSNAAKAINIDRSYLHKKINKYKIKIPQSDTNE